MIPGILDDRNEEYEYVLRQIKRERFARKKYTRLDGVLFRELHKGPGRPIET